MTAQDIKAIKVLSIIATVEHTTKKLILKQTLQSKLKITACLVATIYTVNKKIFIFISPATKYISSIHIVKAAY